MKLLGGILAVLGIAALPLVADLFRSGSERCATDGVDVAPAFRVRIIAADGESRSFCGVVCAQAWLARHDAAPKQILVTDCASGRECRAEAAWYVRTLQAWDDQAPDFIRVFARRADAERHAASYRGTILLDSERPFANAAAGGGDDAKAIH